jgi:hypothetical protein
MSTSSSSVAPLPSALDQSVSEKLSRENYILWMVQVLAAVWEAHLYGYLGGTTSVPSKTIQVEQADKMMKTEDNPAYAAWYAQDQQLLSFLLNSVSKEVLGQVATETLATGVWCFILGMFAWQSRARIIHLCSKLSSMRRGDVTCAMYYS